VVLRVDAGARRPGVSMLVRGATEVASQALKGLSSGLAAVDLHPALVNGAAGVVVSRRGRPLVVIGFTVADGRIAEINAVADPDRVAELAAPALAR